MAMNRQDYIDQGIRDRAAGLPDTKGYSSWQEKAWREGYESDTAKAYEKVDVRLPVKVAEAIQQHPGLAQRALEKALPSATAKHLDFLAAEQTREFKKARPNPRRIQRLADKVETLTRKYMRRMCS